MKRHEVLIAVLAAAVCVLFAAVTTSGGVSLWIEPQWDPSASESEPIGADLVEVEDQALIQVDRSANKPFEVPAWITAVLRVVLIGVAAAVAVALLMAGWSRRPRVRWRRQATNDDFDILPDVIAAVVDQAEAQRSALLDGAPRNAIVRCWLQLELDVAAAGLHRDPSDTSLEFTERVLARYSVDAEAIFDLAARYREARFSDHDLDESDRAAALESLDRLHRTLGAARTSDRVAVRP